MTTERDLPEPVETEWIAPAGHIRLEDGRRVFVQPGDTVMARDLGNTVLFTEHAPATRH